jgi:4-amino-4-deoxy-L-arabinose transferase-like glycosyltransferase
MHPSDWRRHATPKNCLIAAGLVIVLLAGWLRTVAVADTTVDIPFRADTVQYYKTAYNLNKYGVYSHDNPDEDVKGWTPKPDAFLTPGYPLFLTLFVDAPPNAQTYAAITSDQALLATLAVLLTLLLFRPLSLWVALPTALLAALSPHLISAATYVLSETLFSVLLLLSLLVLGLHARAARWYLPALLAGGLLLGLAALTRPVVELFPGAAVFLLFVSYDWRKAVRGAAILLLGFCLAWAPWIARNYISLGRSGDPTNMVNTLAIGIYPDFEYDHMPTKGEPGKLDPQFPVFSRSLGATVQEIGRRFRTDTAEELRWYLIGKPVLLWSWDIAEGGGDVYLYPVLRTPYDSSPLFRGTHDLMEALHWPLVILALCGCLLVWLPRAGGWLGTEALFLTRLASLLLCYNTAVLMVLAPFTRYSIPFLPIQYGMALTALYLAARWIGSQTGRGKPAMTQ